MTSLLESIPERTSGRKTAAPATRWQRGREIAGQINSFFIQHAWILCGLMLLQFVVYTYFFTGRIYSDHTFQNAYAFGYPTLRTTGEGRWMADLLIQLQGGSGVDSFQMFLGTALQAINAILFARLVGVTKRVETVLCGVFICLYPAFLDNYSFAVDHFTFAAGDTLALVGILYWKHARRSILTMVLTALVFMLTLACYQPKVAFVGLLCISYLLVRITEDSSRRHSLKFVLREIALTFAVCLLSGAFYYISFRLTVTKGGGVRAHINTPAEILEMVRQAYPATFLYFWSRVDYLPAMLQWLGLATVASGCIAISYRAFRIHRAATIFVLLLLGATPPALRASYIINDNTWASGGRILYPHGYALLLLAVFVLQTAWLRKIAIAVLVVYCYFFVVLGTQENSAAAFKAEHNFHLVNRLLARIELAVPDVYRTRRPLVIVGRPPEFQRFKYLRVPNSGNQPHIARSSIHDYHATGRTTHEAFNYLVGKDIFIKPGADQLKKAVESARQKNPWPAPDSVYVLDETVVVVVLENNQAGARRAPQSEEE